MSRRVTPCAALVLVGAGTFAALAPGARAAELAVPPRVPPSLGMRAQATPAAPPTPVARASAPAAPARVRAAPPREHPRVVFRAQVAQGVDQGQPSGAPRASGAPLGAEHENTRYMVLGDVVLGARTVAPAQLAMYVGSQFRFDEGPLGTSLALPSAYDPSRERGAVLIRHAWGEASDLPGWLAPLRLRAGRQLREGVGMIHYDGASLAWEQPGLAASVFLGRHVSLWADGLGALDARVADDVPEATTSLVGGARLELGRSSRRWRGGGDVLVWRGTASSAGHVVLRLGLRDELRGETTWHGARLARATVTWRHARLAGAALLVDAQLATPDEWAYDLVVQGRPDTDALARYLDVGPRATTVRGRVRYAWPVWQNLDLLVFAGGEGSTRDELAAATNPRVELGGGADLRLTGGFAAFVFWRSRVAVLPEQDLADGGDDAALPDGDALVRGAAATAPRESHDFALRLRFGLGPRSLTGSGEFFGRVQAARNLPGTGTPMLEGGEPALVRELVSGFRFQLEAWLNENARLSAEYEIAGTPDRTSELRGVQRLRVGAEVRF